MGREVSARYLSERRLAIGEIQFLLGFSEPSASLSLQTLDWVKHHSPTGSWHEAHLERFLSGIFRRSHDGSERRQATVLWNAIYFGDHAGCRMRDDQYLIGDAS